MTHRNLCTVIIYICTKQNNKQKKKKKQRKTNVKKQINLLSDEILL